MYLKIHSTPFGKIIAICDEELLGRVLSEGKIKLDLEKHSEFYKGKKVSEEELLTILSEVENLNAVGKKSLNALKKAGIDTSSAIFIQGIPHLQVYKIKV
jgi:hypothetical protein